MEKIKKVCILDDENYFISQKTLYRNSRCSTTFGSLENSHEIPEPNLELLDDGYKAKWNFENSTWDYIDTKEEDPYSLMNNPPSYYFLMARMARLQEVQEQITEELLNGNFDNYESLMKYKNELYYLPEKIEKNEIDEPILVNDITKYRETKNPEHMITFNWPEKV
jgi:hypothetical protein